MKKIGSPTIQVCIGQKFGMVLDKERKIYTWGINNNGQLGSGDFIDRPTP